MSIDEPQPWSADGIDTLMLPRSQKQQTPPQPHHPQSLAAAPYVAGKEKKKAKPAVSTVEELQAERDGMFDELRTEKTAQDREAGRLAGALGAATGCGPTILSAIDALYADAGGAHRRALDALDARFAPVRAARDAWVAAQLDGHAADAAKARSLRAASDTLPAGLVDYAIATDLRKRADALDAARELAEATLASWFQAAEAEGCPLSAHRAPVPMGGPSMGGPSPDADTRPIAIGLEHLRDDALRARVVALVKSTRKPEPEAVDSMHLRHVF